ncbi:unnamed protein product [Cyprideis torosa]|uniref:Uncharacterized protein n=1 Tax=Cyprideis torosa TaxID=163714 RepID=A0A7R8WM76_9CRUS|nr:unnamed protein product [Cyprideis torosa]CAG0902447.1 unnamed protein product [Cyprideis torosa]
MERELSAEYENPVKASDVISENDMETILRAGSFVSLEDAFLEQEKIVEQDIATNVPRECHMPSVDSYGSESGPKPDLMLHVWNFAKLNNRDWKLHPNPLWFLCMIFRFGRVKLQQNVEERFGNMLRNLCERTLLTKITRPERQRLLEAFGVAADSNLPVAHALQRFADRMENVEVREASDLEAEMATDVVIVWREDSNRSLQLPACRGNQELRFAFGVRRGVRASSTVYFRWEGKEKFWSLTRSSTKDSWEQGLACVYARDWQMALYCPVGVCQKDVKALLRNTPAGEEVFVNERVLSAEEERTFLHRLPEESEEGRGEDGDVELHFLGDLDLRDLDDDERRLYEFAGFVLPDVGDAEGASNLASDAYRAARSLWSKSEHLLVRVKDGDLATSRNWNYLHFAFNCLLNQQLQYNSSRNVVRRGLEFLNVRSQGRVGAEVGFGFDENDSKNRIYELANLQRQKSWKKFLTVTCNDRRTPGVRKLYDAVVSVLYDEYGDSLGFIVPESTEQSVSRICGGPCFTDEAYGTDYHSLVDLGIVEASEEAYSEYERFFEGENRKLQVHRCDATGGRCQKRVDAEGNTRCRFPFSAPCSKSYFEEFDLYYSEEDMEVLRKADLVGHFPSQSYSSEHMTNIDVGDRFGPVPELRGGKWHYAHSQGCKNIPTIPLLWAISQAACNCQECDARFNHAYLSSYAAKCEFGKTVINVRDAGDFSLDARGMENTKISLVLTTRICRVTQRSKLKRYLVHEDLALCPWVDAAQRQWSDIEKQVRALLVKEAKEEKRLCEFLRNLDVLSHNPRRVVETFAETLDLADALPVPEMGCVYLIFNSDDPRTFYIGETLNLRRRYNQHRTSNRTFGSRLRVDAVRLFCFITGFQAGSFGVKYYLKKFEDEWQRLAGQGGMSRHVTEVRQVGEDLVVRWNLMSRSQQLTMVNTCSLVIWDLNSRIPVSPHKRRPPDTVTTSIVVARTLYLLISVVPSSVLSTYIVPVTSETGGAAVPSEVAVRRHCTIGAPQVHTKKVKDDVTDVEPVKYLLSSHKRRTPDTASSIVLVPCTLCLMIWIVLSPVPSTSVVAVTSRITLLICNRSSNPCLPSNEEPLTLGVPLSWCLGVSVFRYGLSSRLSPPLLFLALREKRELLPCLPKCL